MDDAALKKAAWYWAQFRNTFGKQPTDPTAHRLDADVLICSQAWWYADTHGIPAVIATDNIKDFTPLLDDRFVVDANRWNAIAP